MQTYGRMKGHTDVNSEIAIKIFTSSPNEYLKLNKTWASVLIEIYNLLEDPPIHNSNCWQKYRMVDKNCIYLR